MLPEGKQAVNRHFRIDYYPWNRVLFSLGGHGPNVTSVEVSPELVRVRAGWVFQADVPRRSITRAYRRSNPWWNVGGTQTNLFGSWAVSGSYRHIVALDLAPHRAGGYAPCSRCPFVACISAWRSGRRF